VLWKKNSYIELNNLIHPYRSAELYSINQQKMGVFGQIHPFISKKSNISPEIYLFEFDIKKIQNEIQKNKISTYKEYPAYPKILKDLSFIINTNVTFEELKTVLYFNGTQFLSEIKLLDEYKGQSMDSDNKSLCVQLVFQAKDKTLENKDIEIILKNLYKVLIKKFGATIRE
jgi:phenylalanyl-tRNA synthetase beta chain